MSAEHMIHTQEQPAENIVWESYASPLHAMRRTQLWRLADLHEIKYPRGAAKDIMLRLIENWEIVAGEGAAVRAPKHMSQDTFLKAIQGPSVEYDELRAGMATGQTNVNDFADAIEGVSHFETVVEPPFVAPLGQETADVEDMKMPELRQTAKAMGLSQSNKDKAEDLRARIRGKDTS